MSRVSQAGTFGWVLSVIFWVSGTIKESGLDQIISNPPKATHSQILMTAVSLYRHVMTEHVPSVSKAIFVSLYKQSVSAHANDVCRLAHINGRTHQCFQPLFLQESSSLFLV